jgi:two-component system chemotaxis response regulator CheY
VEPISRASILVVEDDAAIRYAVREVLARGGFDVITASDGREALTHISARPSRFSLILTDWILPVMSGLQLLAAIARHPLHGGTPIVVLSGHDRIESADLGVTAVLQKPVRTKTLLDVVGRLVGMPPSSGASSADSGAVPTTRQIASTIALRRPPW